MEANEICERFCNLAKEAGYILKDPDESDFDGVDKDHVSAVYVVGYKEKSAEEFFGNEKSLSEAKSNLGKLISKSIDPQKYIKFWLKYHHPTSAYGQLEQALFQNKREPFIISGGYNDDKWIVIFSTKPIGKRG